jgi:hypothetical protein
VVAVGKSAAPSALGMQFFPPLAELAVILGTAKEATVLEQVQIDRQAITVKAVLRTLTGLRVENGLLWRSVGLTKREFVSHLRRLLDQLSNQTNEQALSLSEGHDASTRKKQTAINITNISITSAAPCP